MFILLFLILLVILNICASVIFAINWDKEKENGSPPLLIYITLGAALSILFILIIPYLSKLILTFIKLSFKEIFVYAYLIALVTICYIIVQDWDNVKHENFKNSWKLIVFLVAPICIFLIVLSMLYYAKKSGQLKSILDLKELSFDKKK